MKPLHICFVETGYPHAHGGGGAGTYVQLVGRELVRCCHRVSVIAAFCPDCPPVYDDEGITVYRLAKESAFHWYFSKLPYLGKTSLVTRYLEIGWRIYRLLESLHHQNPFDVVEFTEGGDFWHAWKASFPYVVHLHGSRYTFLHQTGREIGWADWLHRWLELRFVQRATYVVAPCCNILKVVEAENGRPFPKTKVIPYPLDKQLLQPLHKVKKEGTSPTILFAARNDPVKGANILLNAVPRVRQKYPNAEFHFYGFQPRPDDVIPEGVFIHPFVPKEELLYAYQQADICVVPSLWDNSPNTVYEAMAAGAAVVASCVGGIPELITNGETGMLVPPGDVAALTQVLIRLIDEPQKRKQLAESGMNHMRSLADVTINVERRLELWHTCSTQGLHRQKIVS